MPILQRCPKCRQFFPPRSPKCPRCGAGIQPRQRKLYFSKKIAGQRHYRAVGNKPLDEAERLYGQWINEIGEPVDPRDIPLRTLADDYLEKLKSEGKVYHRLAALFLSRMVEFWGDPVARDISADMVKRFQAALRAGGASPAYADRHLAIGKAAWNYSLQGHPNPFSMVRFYHPDNTLVRELSTQEEKNLLLAAKCVHDNSPVHFYEMILLALNTGMRESNILQLQASEVDFARNQINVIGKGGRRIQIYMNEAVQEALAGITPSQEGWFFPNPLSGKPYTRIDKTFATVKRLAKIERPFRFHDLRHHFAKRLAQATGGNVLVVKTALAHSSISTTMKYIAPFDREVQDALDKLNASRDNHKDNQPLTAVNK